MVGNVAEEPGSSGSCQCTHPHNHKDRVGASPAPAIFSKHEDNTLSCFVWKTPITARELHPFIPISLSTLAGNDEPFMDIHGVARYRWKPKHIVFVLPRVDSTRRYNTLGRQK
ncbi:hypothetical protein J6590_019810 [Homalodisca vitripennis]|nr:hypothetical protein J6590_019810 [Homalodisca vitripennis]